MPDTSQTPNPIEAPRTILAIESSTPEASVALRSTDGALLERAVETGDRERDHLPTAIDELLRGAGSERGRIDGVAVSEGPGGFTGLRVSVAMAMGIAEALRVPALGLSSALVAAASTLEDDDRRTAYVVMSTKRGTAWLERIECRNDSPRRFTTGGGIVDTSAAAEAADAIDPRAGVVLADRRQDPAIVAALVAPGMERVEPRCSAAAIVRLAEGTPVGDGWADPATLAVRYPRVPEAVTLWNAASHDR